MKVYNISDVSTSFLEMKGRVAVPVSLGGILILPGECREVRERYRAEAARFQGIIALDRLPPGYTTAVKIQPKKRVQPEPERVFRKREKTTPPLEPTEG